MENLKLIYSDYVELGIVESLPHAAKKRCDCGVEHWHLRINEKVQYFYTENGLNFKKHRILQ
jgi:hypothetical protein